MALADILDLVKDKVELAEEIKKTYGAAEALEKVRANNADLIKQRESWDNEKKTLSDELKSLKSSNSNASPPEIRALEEKLSQLSEKLDAAEKTASNAMLEKMSTDLKNAVLASATTAISPNQVYALMAAEGLVGHKDGKAFFYRTNATGEMVAVKSSDAVEAYLKSNPHLAKPSEAVGSGIRQHQSGNFTSNGLLKDAVSYL